ncbi:MAG: hypothetical protein RJQ09_18010 [Cyclobacteriaceae bacterium]
MLIPFANRQPTSSEIRKLSYLIGVFGDGFGAEKDKWGRTRAGWKQMERVIAEFFGGLALEQMAVFDVLLPINEYSKIYGFSVKTKSLPSTKFNSLDDNGRVYIELNNSLSKLWNPIKALGFNEQNFKLNTGSSIASEMGKSIINTVQSWYREFNPQAMGVDGALDFEASKHIVISYTTPKKNSDIRYRVDAFNLKFPSGILWEFHSPKCLRGYEKGYQDGPLFEWYGLSGGQLKYYPRAKMASHSSKVFQVPHPKVFTISQRAMEYWPKEWVGL